MSGHVDLGRFQELLDALVNQTLTPGQHADLQSVLRDSPEFQRRYLEYMDLHIGLGKLLRSEGLTVDSLSGDTLARRAGEAADLSLPSSPPGSAERHSSVVRWTGVDMTKGRGLLDSPRFRIVMASIAVMLLVGLASLILRPDRADVVTTEPVRLFQAAGAVFFGKAVPPVGGSLEYGREYALTSGMVELRFPNGAEVILEAPSVIEIKSGDRLVVKVGACSVHAPPGAEGFRVETPQADVVDLGTRFSINVNEVGETDVQVVEGAADVKSRNNPANSRTLRLTPGQSRRFRENVDGTSQPLPFDPQRYRHDLPDRVVSYNARPNREGHVDELLNVTVQRGGENIVYPVRDLIGVEVTHFRARTNGHNIAVSASAVDARRETLESDRLLNTGIINPGGAELPLATDPQADTPGMAVRFRQPVRNGPGPDIVFFDLQSVVDPQDGDAFHVSPLTFAAGLRSHSIRRYDITMLSPEARSLVEFDLRFFTEAPRTLDDLLNKPTGHRHPPLRFRALAVGIDLSDLGYPDQAEVDGLFFQDALDDDHQVDPVFIAGLPVKSTKGRAP